MSLPITIILVPQGPEYRAVCQGVSRAVAPPLVLPMPVGPAPLNRYLTAPTAALTGFHQPRVLLMGLCGSLISHYGVGQVVLYRGCVSRTNRSRQLLPCDPELTMMLQQRLLLPTPQVRALTSDRLVWAAAEKQQLHRQYQAEVVDMEGYAALEVLSPAKVPVAMVRAISDNWDHDLPDLNPALDPNGSLQPFPLAIGLLRQPLAAARLIRGSLRGLQALRNVAANLFTEP